MRTYTLPKTKRGAVRQLNAILRRTAKADRGGMMFGRDWPTFRLNHPQDYAHIQAMKDTYTTLPA